MRRAAALALGVCAAADDLVVEYAVTTPDGRTTLYASRWYVALCAAGIAGVYLYFALLAARACREKCDIV